MALAPLTIANLKYICSQYLWVAREGSSNMAGISGIEPRWTLVDPLFRFWYFDSLVQGLWSRPGPWSGL